MTTPVGHDQLQLDLERAHLHPATQGVIAEIEAIDHPAGLQGMAPHIGRVLLEGGAPSADFDEAAKALKERKRFFRATPEMIAAEVEPDIAPDPRPKPLSRTRPTPKPKSEAERSRDWFERANKDS